MTKFKGHDKLPDTKEEQMRLACERVKDHVWEYYNQWGFPPRQQNILSSARNFRAPLATYAEFVEYATTNGYVEQITGIEGIRYLLPGGNNFTRAFKIEALIRAQEMHIRFANAKQGRK